MSDEATKLRRDLLWAWPTSLILHGFLIAVLLAYSQPRLPEQQEEAVNVTLVPPPPAQPMPKPAPPSPAKQAEAEKPAEPKQPPAPEAQPPSTAQIEVLKPVFRFGDKDAGSGKSPESGSVEETAPSPAKDEAVKPPAEERPDAADDAAKQAAKDSGAVQEAESEPVPNQDTGKPEADKQEGLREGADTQAASAPALLGALGTDGEIALPAMAKAPEPRPANAPRPSLSQILKPRSGKAGAPGTGDADAAASQPFSGLPGVRRPQSQGATGAALSTTAMAGLPRDKRAAQLCASALQRRLVDASYSPDLVPLVPLRRGNVLDVPEAAFRTRTAWHALTFRCEVEAEATTIRSLTFRVGATIPPDQWARLGLPAGN